MSTNWNTAIDEALDNMQVVQRGLEEAKSAFRVLGNELMAYRLGLWAGLIQDSVDQVRSASAQASREMVGAAEASSRNVLNAALAGAEMARRSSENQTCILCGEPHEGATFSNQCLASFKGGE